jgi:chloramphenicol 3-O-phosphotransferase
VAGRPDRAAGALDVFFVGVHCPLRELKRRERQRGDRRPGEAAGVLVSTGSRHGGQETTVLTLMAPLLHLGMIVVGVPYSTQELVTTQGVAHPTVRDTSRRVITSAKSTNRKRRSAARLGAVWQESV